MWTSSSSTLAIPQSVSTHGGGLRPPVSKRIPFSSTNVPSASWSDHKFTGVRRGWRVKRNRRLRATPISTIAVDAPARTKLSRASP
jgi:hypothetical protein